MIQKRAIALDIGDKTCGIAMSDPFGWTAQPLTNLRFKGIHEKKIIFPDLLKIITENEVKIIVIGLPLNMNGTEGPQAGKVRDFITAFKKYIGSQNLSVSDFEWLFWDERLSTVGAGRSLLEADLSRAKRSQVIDKMAAVFILQGYLGSKSSV